MDERDRLAEVRARQWFYDFELPDGTRLEGHGVVPDVSINANWTDYTERDDPYILRAVELLKQGQGTSP